MDNDLEQRVAQLEYVMANHQHENIDGTKALENNTDVVSVYGRMYLAGVQSIPDTTETKVALETTSFSSGITADTTNSRFTALTEGYYFVVAQILYDSPVTNKYLQAILELNGTGTQNAYSAIISNGTNVQGTRVENLIHLDPDEYVELFTYQNCGGAEGLQSGTQYTYLDIFQV